VTPNNIAIKQSSRVLRLEFSQRAPIELSFEYLRVFSPSAEVRGHGKGNEVLQWGKRDVSISGAEAVGHYALKLIFDDGHDTGIYSWSCLLELADNYEANWQQYLAQLQAANRSRDPNVQILRL